MATTLHPVAILLVALCGSCAAVVAEGEGGEEGGTATPGAQPPRRMTPGTGGQGTPAAQTPAPSSPSSPVTTPGTSPVTATPAGQIPLTVALSEIMYHAVMDDGAEERHEFVELHNRGSAAAAMGGWKLIGGIEFTFAPGATLPPGGFVVVAKDPKALAAVASYQLRPETLLGPYTGQLDNGGARVMLLDAHGAVVDEVPYDDRAPWPMGADALGAGEAWLPRELLPLAAHQNRGRSLERISFELPSNDPANWAASALDAATPGRANGSAGSPQTIALALSAVPASGGAQIRAGDEVRIEARLSKQGTLGRPEVEYFVEDREKPDSPRQRVPLQPSGETWQARLPGQPTNTIVRYRIVGDRGDGKSALVAPRPSDPLAHFGYFVAPESTAKTPAYHLFLKKANWTQLFHNISPGRVPGGQCKPNPNWDARVPAVMVHEGRVIDVFARYQGSPYQRWSGWKIDSWPAGEAPGAPAPLLMLGWRIALPRYAEINGQRTLVFNKRSAECGNLTTDVGGRLLESVGVPTSQVGYGRLHINGHYYHLMSVIEHPDENLLKRFFGKAHQVGDLFKVVGYNGEQGPWTWGDSRRIVPGCQYTAPARYDLNYDRKTPEWRTGSREVEALIEALQVARATSPDAVKKFFADTFDLPLLTSYIATLNWMGPHDDFWQNHFFYRRADGRWMLLAWDFDQLFGGNVPASGSFYLGEIADRSNRSVGIKWKNDLKDAFIKAFRPELHARLVELSRSNLETTRVHKLIDELTVKYNVTEAREALSRAACDPPGFVARMKKFTVERNARIAAGTFN